MLDVSYNGDCVVATRVPLHEIDKVQRDSTSGKYLRKVESENASI